MNSRELIAIYENVAVITDQMVSAAQELDWELLARLEQSCSLQVQAIRDNDGPVPLEQEQRQQKLNVIKKILADDKKIREITEPRMVVLSQLMESTSAKRKLAQSYFLDHRTV